MRVRELGVGFILGALGMTLAASLPILESEEPPLTYRLKVEGGETLPLRLGEPIELATPNERTRLTLEADEFRSFQRHGIRFRYPAHFRWELEREQGYEVVFIEGPDVLIGVHRYSDDEDPADMVEYWVKTIMEEYEFQEGRTEKRSLKWRLGRQELEGIELDAVIGGTFIRHSVVGFRSAGSVIVFSLQDPLGEDGSSSVEGRETKKMLEESFSLIERR